MKTYEITYLTVAEETHDAATVNEALASNGGKIVSVHPWGSRRRLAYPIKKQDQAFYTTVVFEAEPSALKPLDRALNLNNDVLRFLIVEFEPGYFQRAQASQTEAPAVKESEEAATPAPAVEETPVTEEVSTPAREESTEETSEEEKPKRKRATKKSDEEQKELDEKIDALLNEDIAK